MTVEDAYKNLKKENKILYNKIINKIEYPHVSEKLVAIIFSEAPKSLYSAAEMIKILKRKFQKTHFNYLDVQRAASRMWKVHKILRRKDGPYPNDPRNPHLFFLRKELLEN